MADMNLGGMPKGKKVLVFAVGGAVVVGGLLWWRHRQNAAAAAAAPSANTSATQEGASCTDAYGNPGVYDATGNCVVTGTGASGIGYGVGAPAGGGGFGFGGQGGSCTDINGNPGYLDAEGNCVTTGAMAGGGAQATNAAWAAAAEKGLGQSLMLDAALGKYLTGQPLSQAQHAQVDRAIGLEGPPPVAGPGGFPPAVHLQKGGGDGQGGRGGKGTHVIIANGRSDLYDTAHDNGIGEEKLIDLNPGLRHLRGSRRPIPRGTKVTV